MRFAPLVFLAACGARSGLLVCLGDEGAGDGPLVLHEDGAIPGVSFQVEIQTIAQVDLLVLVDNSPSMREEQANLTANFADLVSALVAPPDEDADGEADWHAVESLHVGVVTPDMGTSGYPIQTCDNAERGDDGVLQNLPAAGMITCESTYPKFLEFDAIAGDDPIGFSDDFSCIATLGDGGCGFEQQLFAVEKALTVHAVPGGANDGFLRPDALLAVLIMTDEDDCSIADPAIFGDDDSLGPLNLRCFANSEMVRPVEEFVDSILSAKPFGAGWTVIAAITGVPPDLVALTDAELDAGDLQDDADYRRILGDERMMETIDYSPEGGGNRLIPSCDVPGLGIAFPPRRIVELVQQAEQAGASGVVQSICQADWAPTMRAISHLVWRQLTTPGCLRPETRARIGFEVQPGDVVPCAVYEALPDARDCRGPARIDRGVVDGRRICQICQKGEASRGLDAFGLDVSTCPEDPGWSIDLDSAACSQGELVFGSGAGGEARPVGEATVYFECTCTPTFG